MLEKSLQLAILAQALVDVLDPSTPDHEAENAWSYLSNHDKIIRKLRRMTPEAKASWLIELKEVLYGGILG